MMTERMHRVIALIEQLPAEVQDAAAAQLEAWAKPVQDQQSSAPQKSYAGVWRDLPDADTMIDELDRLRHATPPSLPFTDEEL